MDKRRALRVICALASGERGEGQWGAPTGDHRVARVMRVRNARGKCAWENGGANFACVMAVGRDVPIAPHRPVAVRNGAHHARANIAMAWHPGTR